MFAAFECRHPILKLTEPRYRIPAARFP